MSGINTRIAGFNHHAGSAERLSKMRTGERLLLVPDPGNEHDPNAIKIVTTSGHMLGYVPRVDAPGVLAKLNNPDVLVRCHKSGTSFNSVTITYITGDPLA
jgi:hypothetical protein